MRKVETITKVRLRSDIVENADYIDDKDNYSDLQVLESAAGFYIGTTYRDPEFNVDLPGSRDSAYFKTKEEAQALLANLNLDYDEYSTFLRE